jgi:glycosyltransferase involved in cell wall biosynthesis
MPTDEAAAGVTSFDVAATPRARRTGATERQLRVLFFNEGNLGNHVLGHNRLEHALNTGLKGMKGVEARFAGLSPMQRLANAAATRPIEPLRRAGLDMQTLRWHLVQSLRARGELAQALQSWPADVVHLYTPAVALALGSTVRGVPIVLSMDTTVHEWWAMPAWRPRQRYAPATIAPSRALERRALARAALVLARTRWVRESVEREAPGVRVIEHHPGIDLARYQPAPRRERTLPRVLFVGGRFAEKGGEDLLAALGEDLGRTVELDLVTPADIPTRPGMRIHRLNPSDPQLLDLQQQADIFCLPTHGDTNPWAIVEAMACGTPVISTSVGGIPDLLDDGRAGVLVPHGNRAALREALLALLADDDRRSRLGVAARQRCDLHYDAKLQVPQLIEHLRSVV